MPQHSDEGRWDRWQHETCAPTPTHTYARTHAKHLYTCVSACMHACVHVRARNGSCAQALTRVCPTCTVSQWPKGRSQCQRICGAELAHSSSHPLLKSTCRQLTWGLDTLQSLRAVSWALKEASKSENFHQQAPKPTALSSYFSYTTLVRLIIIP